MKHLILAVLVLATFVAGGTGYACTCPRTPTVQEFESRADQLRLDTWIFVGKVSSSRRKTSTMVVRLKMMVAEVRELFGGEPYWAPDDLRNVVEFSIVENFRGPSSESKLEASSGTCGPFFEVGKQYLVVATRKADSEAWLAEGCTPTAPVEAAAESIGILRAKRNSAAADSRVDNVKRLGRMRNNALQATCGDAGIYANRRQV